MSIMSVFMAPLFIILRGGGGVIQLCIVCSRSYGEKEPLEVKGFTNGLCMECFKKRLSFLGIDVEDYQKVFERSDCDNVGIEAGDSGEALLP